MKKLRSVIVQKQFVNCYSKEFSPGDRSTFEPFLLNIGGIHKQVIYIDIDNLNFEQCENEEQEAVLLLDLIGKEWQARGFGDLNINAISIADALHKWSNTLNIDQKVLLVFHFLHDIYNEKEKNILRSLRRVCRSELSAFLKILIISTQPLSKWELFPDSNLDERHVTLFLC
jgi:hypothetical protein